MLLSPALMALCSPANLQVYHSCIPIPALSGGEAEDIQSYENLVLILCTLTCCAWKFKGGGVGSALPTIQSWRPHSEADTVS